MAINTTSGAKFFISSAAVLDTVDTITEFEALTWIEVKEVENIGEFGDEASAVNFAAIGDGRVRKGKGARDAGTLALIVGADPLDAGQLAMIAAEGTNNNYAFKIINPDGPTEDYSDSIYYLRGLVMSKRMNMGTNDNVVRRTFNIGINSPIYEDPAEETP